MKRIVYITIFHLFLLTGCTGDYPPHAFYPDALADSCYSRQAVFAIIDTTEAFLRIDEGVRLGKIALADARLMRAQIWQNNNIKHLGYDYIKSYLYEDSVQLVPLRRMMYHDYLMRAISVNGSSLAIQHATEMAKAARELGREDRVAYGDFMVAYNSYIGSQNQKNDKLFHDMSLALDRLLECHTEEQLLPIHCFSYLQNALLENNEPDSLLSVCKKEEAYLTTVPNTRFYESCYPILYGNMAKAYWMLGKEQKAMEAYSKWKNTKLAKQPVGKASIFSFLIRTSWGREEGINMAPEIIEYFRDKEPSMYANVFYELAFVYSAKGDYQSAYKNMLRYDSIRSEINMNKFNKESLQWAKKYELQKKDFEIEKERAHNRLAWIITWFTFITLIAITTAFIYYLRTSREARQKNRLLAIQLEKIERYRTEVSQLKISALHRKDMKNAADAISDAELFDKMDKLTNERQLFMTPKYPITEMAQLLEVSQARLLTFFKNSPEYNKLDDYMDMKRIAKACQILRTQPGQSMQNVSDMSGFTNTRQFNRKFREAMGMAPSEFRAID